MRRKENGRSTAVSRVVGFVLLAFFIVLFAAGVGFLMLRFANSFF